jgi:hypothetical protein
MSPTRLTTIRDGIAPLRLYPVLALLSFPTPGGTLAGLRRTETASQSRF